MGNVDPEQKFTGGVSIEFVDNYGMKRGEGHIALEKQPLSAFVEAVLTEKGIISEFTIFEFCKDTGKMKVMLLALI